MVTKALEKLSDYIGRRRFLGFAVKASVVLASSILGIETASAAVVGPACCGLCSASSECSGTCCWCWTCCDSATTHKMWKCTECYTSCPDSACNTGTTTSNCKTTCCNHFNDHCPGCAHDSPLFKCSNGVCLGVAC